MNVGTDSRLLPPIPDLATVAEVIRLAEAAAAERYDQRPADYPMYRGDDLDLLFRPEPARDALLAHLGGLPEETVAGLYALYRLGDRPWTTPAGATRRYRYSYDLAMEPMHRRYGATDLAAKGPLASGLRRGLDQLGLRLEADPAGGSGTLSPGSY